MIAPRFADQLNIQIGNELAAHNQYLACAVYYDALTMPQMAAFFYGQALEERDHAMMMVQYLLDTDIDVVIPGVDAPIAGFDDVVAPVELALAQEKRVSEQINGLLRIAREEQRLRLRAVHAVVHQGAGRGGRDDERPLAVVTRNCDDIEDIEEYVAREQASTRRGPDGSAYRRRVTLVGCPCAVSPRAQVAVASGQDTSRGEPVWTSSGRVRRTSSVNSPACSVRTTTSVTNEPDRDESDSQPPISIDSVTSADSATPISTGVRSSRVKSRGSSWSGASPTTRTGSRPSLCRRNV